MQPTEIEAKTVEEAIKKACIIFNTTEDKLQVEVIEKNPNRFFSLLSGKNAKIKASFIQETLAKSYSGDDDPHEALRTILESIVKAIEPDARVETVGAGGETCFNIIGNGSGIFIGKRGQTLEALQYLINKIKSSKFKNIPPVTVDSESYRKKHEKSLLSLAKHLSEKAKKRKKPVNTSPMNPTDRRVIHMALKGDVDLTTWSKGEGLFKKVIIAPKRQQ